MNVGKVPLALSLLRAELGLSQVRAGWVSSVLSTLTVVAALGFGLLAGRIGALTLVLGGLGLSAAASPAALAVYGAGADAGGLLSREGARGWRFAEVGSRLRRIVATSQQEPVWDSPSNCSA